jgi:D-lactate dehydrogenase
MDKIVFFEIEEWEKEHISKALANTQLAFTNGKAHEEINPEFYNSSIISVFIYSMLSRDVLDKFPNLKLIATRSTGYDHIDLAYCKERGITVVNVPSYGAHSVAEHTFALILAVCKKIVRTVNRTRRGDFSLDELRGFDLYGKTLGVIGSGKIGRKVVDIALCFGMNVLIHTRHAGKDAEKMRFVSLEELFGSSDIISLHVPYSKETHHLINRENIRKFKKGSVLINTARGPLVETQAILEGLESGILSAAGLDVLEEECYLKEERELLTDNFLQKCDIKTQLLNHVLLQRSDVLFTSHNAFNSLEALIQILDITSGNITAFLDGKRENIVE